MENFEALIELQNDHVTAIKSTLINFKKLAKNKRTATAIRARMTKVQNLWTTIQDEHRRIRLTATQEQLDNHDYFVQNMYQVFGNDCDEVLDFFSSVLTEDDDQSVDSASSAGEEKPRIDAGSSFRLPPIQITKFSGNLTDWEKFKSRFETLVINNRKLNDMQRLYHLISSLEGEASSKIDHLELTSDDFQIAWKILEDKYEDRCRIAYAHFDTLLSLSNIDSKDPKSIGNLRDKISSALAQLKRLNLPVEQWSILIAYLILRKFDRETDDEWEDKRQNVRELPTYAEVDSFLQMRSHKLEAIAAKRSNNVKPSNSDRGSRVKSITSFSVNTFKPKCFVCNSEHHIYQCVQFQSMTIDERRQLVLNQKRCFNCLSLKHQVKNCTNQHRCKTCQKSHHTLLHFSNNNDVGSAVALASNIVKNSIPVNVNESLDQDITSIAAVCSDCDARTSVLRPTARLHIYSPTGRRIVVRAFLDQGSESNFISENLVQLLRLPTKKRDTRITGITDHDLLSHAVASVEFSPAFENSPTHSMSAVVIKSLNRITPPQITKTYQWTHFRHLTLADPNPLSNDSFDVMIGAGVLGQILRSGVIRGKEDEPIAQNTSLGWILSGFLNQTVQNSTIQAHVVSLEHINVQLKQFWEIEEVPRVKPLSPEDQACNDFFSSTYQRTGDGRYIVRLPFKSEFTGHIGESRSVALRRLCHLESRLSKHPKLKTDYIQFLQDYEDSSHMSRVDPSVKATISIPYYIPHHPVIRAESATTKLRVVFNASQNTSMGVSLNDVLMAGPKLQVDLPIIMMRWRMFQYIMTADVRQMYRQILIHPDDIDYQRILWRKSPSDALSEYRLNTVTYGTTSAPYLAIKTLHQLVSDEGSHFPLASNVILRHTYVDDVIFGSDDVDAVIRTRNQLISLLRKGGFELHKWASNFNLSVSEADPEVSSGESKTFKLDDQVKILGIGWSPNRDQFHFNLNSDPFKATKRTILSVIARFFDPLGWISPLIISAKIFLQKLWKLKCNWDDDLPHKLKDEWFGFYNSLSAIQEVTIARWTQYNSTTSQVELHGFCDASSKAYAAVIYLKVKNPSNQITSSLIVAKSKVAPLKTLSIPRLELCAAHLLSQLMNTVKEALFSSEVPCYCWSDSSVALEWIRNSPSRWKTFIANRVTAIQELGPRFTWKYVPTRENPADCASRGISAEILRDHSLWWSGPLWLIKPSSEWPKSLRTAIDRKDMEENPTYNVVATQCAGPWDLQFRYSSWSKLLRITAYCQRFIRRIRFRQPLPQETSCVTPAEIHQARIYWLKVMQSDAFKTELLQLQANKQVKPSSSLSSLVPFLDSDGLMRVSGRLQNTVLPDQTKYPIVLSSHYLLKLMISEIHLRLLHGGHKLVLSRLRQEYWIFRSRQVIRSVLHRCVPCVRHQAAMAKQLMGSLPESRVTHGDRAFCNVGIDYAGPIQVRQEVGRGHRSHKAYIAVFVCMASKAAHLELVTSYSTSAFIAAFQRFTSRRGLPSNIYCDNGTNFKGAETELQHQFQAAYNDSSFITRIASEGIKWNFIPPSAPHFGGLWEAAVKSVKYHIKRCVGTLTFSYEEFQTLLCKVEACLNSRPLGALSENIEDYQCLTPGHFLIGSALTASPEPSLLNVRENRLSRWQRIHRALEEFWRAWQRDYVLTLQQRQKWRTMQQSIKPGKLVLINQSGLPPSHWELGRVMSCNHGPDGVVRVVTLKTASTVLKRPIVKLCLLPIDINNAEEANVAMAGGVD